MTVELERDDDDALQLGPVIAPFYPQRKDEGWWLVVGTMSGNGLLTLKKVNLQQKSKLTIEFPAPVAEGPTDFKLYFMCDSFTGCDQEFEFSLDVKEKLDDDSSEEESDEEMSGDE